MKYSCSAELNISSQASAHRRRCRTVAGSLETDLPYSQARHSKIVLPTHTAHKSGGTTHCLKPRHCVSVTEAAWVSLSQTYRSTMKTCSSQDSAGESQCYAGKQCPSAEA